MLKGTGRQWECGREREVVSIERGLSRVSLLRQVSLECLYHIYIYIYIHIHTYRYMYMCIERRLSLSRVSHDIWDDMCGVDSHIVNSHRVDSHDTCHRWRRWSHVVTTRRHKWRRVVYRDTSSRDVVTHDVTWRGVSNVVTRDDGRVSIEGHLSR